MSNKPVHTIERRQGVKLGTGHLEGGIQQGLLKINRALQSNAFGDIVKGGMNIIDGTAQGHQIFHFNQPIGDQFELCDGIPVISTDFIALGKRAAQ